MFVSADDLDVAQKRKRVLSVSPLCGINSSTFQNPHCATLMNPTLTEMGVAYAVDPKSDMGVYWTQAFGTPR